MDENQNSRDPAESTSHKNAIAVDRPSAGARCERCGSANLAFLPTFATGTGSAYRTIMDDVYCLYCGHIAQPAYELTEIDSISTEGVIGRRSLKRREPPA